MSNKRKEAIENMVNATLETLEFQQKLLSIVKDQQDALNRVRELADKFEREDNGDPQAMLRYQLAASRIRGAIGGEQA